MLRFFVYFFFSAVLLADLPEYKPPFQPEALKRLPPELKTGSFLQYSGSESSRT